MPARDRKQWTGLEKAIAQLRASSDEVLQAAASVLTVQAETIMTTSKKRDVPVDEGPLRASGHVQKPERSLSQVSVLLGFGGPAGSGNRGESNDEDVGYAVRVHEDISTFGLSPGGGMRGGRAGERGDEAEQGRTGRTYVGRAKYLEIPALEQARKITQNMARWVSRQLRKALAR